MKTVCTVWALVATLMVANSVSAAGKKKEAKTPGIAYYQTVDRYLKPVTLTDDQKAKLEALKKEYEPKFKDAYAKQKALTPEQVKAGAEAKKAAAEAGKKGKEAREAVEKAINETDAQKQQEKDAKKAISTLEKEMHAKVLELLTPKQKDQIKAAAPKKGEKPAKKAAKAAADAAPAAAK